MLTRRIGVHPAEGTWVVRAGGAVIGESGRALELIEGDLPSVIYFPREGIGMAFLEPSPTVTVCPYKGKASYFTIVTKSGPIRDAAWSYENPKEEVGRIAGHIAFFRDKVTVEEV